MVKSNQPLQIRLTEPVVFLRGPSTGLDFRGRPQGIDPNAAPAQLRGLLTLRLSKATRIRRISVRLEGKARTEWPEGIGPRRLDTFEEHIIIHETTTFFDAKRNRSQSARRAASVGPGVYEHSYDVGLDDLIRRDDPMSSSFSRLGDENDGLDVDEERGRGRQRNPLPRSASALPGTYDSSWYTSNGSRRPSYDGDASRPPSGEIPSIRDLQLNDARGPSPAYTPTAEAPSSRPPSLNPPAANANPNSPRGFRETVLSPIQSAAPSRAPSDRDDSTETQYRLAADGLPATRLDDVAERGADTAGSAESAPESESETEPAPEPHQGSASPIVQTPAAERTETDSEEDHGHAIRSILSGTAGTGAGRAGGAGEVRFANSAQADGEVSQAGPSRVGVNGDYHPAGAAIQAISAVSTAHNSPAPSRPQSIRTLQSTDHLPLSVDHSPVTPSRLSNESTRSTPSIHSNRSIRSNHSVRASRSANDGPPPVSNGSSRRSSLLRDTRLALSTNSSAASSTASLQEVRQGRKNRHGSHSTIVINTDPSVPPGPPIEPISSRPSTRPSSPTRRTSGPYAHAPNLLAEQTSRNTEAEDRGRRGGSRFSLAATLRGISKDVKDRVRAGSRSKSRVPSASGPSSAGGSGFSSTADFAPQSNTTNSASASSMRGRGVTPSRGRDESTSRSRSTSRQIANAFLPPHLDRAHSSSRSPAPVQRRAMRSGSFTQDPDFVAPYGRGGAARVNHSRERERSRDESASRADVRSRSRTASPGGMGLGRVQEEERGKGKSKERSPSRGRGRNKGMKVLTDALGLGDGEAEDKDKDKGEDVHNWKEFRKGVYNYPISFPIPLTAPPTIKAEFGSVVYRLKATVVRVGALTPNLVEELEVTMIATPQEDDLEETENVIVERQWEEQMRYQIALSGKAFPIGGTIPMSIRLMPLMKCKVHRLSVCLEEKSDYFAQGRKVVRHETPRKYMMLFIKQPDKKERIEPLLPIISDDVDAARASPLAEMAKAAALNNPANYTNFAGELDDDALYATLMDPMGPWHLERELQIPDCGQKVRFTTKHDKTNIAVSHWLKVTIRVERGDDEAVDAKGRRKLFDIIIETPIKMLDCRVNPQYNSLPTYSSFLPHSGAALTGLCSVHGTKGTVSQSTAQTALISRNSHSALHGGAGPSGTAGSGSGSTILANGVPLGSPQHGHGHGHGPGGEHGGASYTQLNGLGKRREDDDTLLERNIVYDRLMSGQETEEGDVPPSYEVAAVGSRHGSVSGSASASASGLGLNGMGNARSGSVSAMGGGGSGGGSSRSRPPHPLRRESSARDQEEEEDGVVRMGESSRSRERRERERAVREQSAAGSRERSRSRLR